MTAASIGLALIPSLFPFTLADDQFFLSQPLPTIEESLKMAIATFFGAYVARVPFVVATIVYYSGLAIWAFYVLTLVAEPVQPVSIFEVAARNSIGSVIGLLAAVAGADLGMRFKESQSENVAEAM